MGEKTEKEEAEGGEGDCVRVGEKCEACGGMERQVMEGEEKQEVGGGNTKWNGLMARCRDLFITPFFCSSGKL